MSKKKLGIASIEVNKKFVSEEEANKYAKRLISYIRYVCKKNANRDWLAQAMVISSNLKKEVSLLEYKSNGKKGRPSKGLRINDRIANDWYKGEYTTDWHLHILIVAKPIYAFRDIIKDYIDKNWINIPTLSNELNDSNINLFGKKKVYKKNCDINIAQYFINQSSKVLFCNCNYGSEENLKYSLKQYHNEYLKKDSALIRLYKKHHLNPMSEERYFKELNKIECKFKDIENYYDEITKEERINEQKEYMNNVRLNKIAENYNKVQNIHRQRIDEDSIL